MCFEIERRFLIRNNDWGKLINHKSDIIQGYLSSSSESWIVRIRSEDNLFKLTLKKYISKSKNFEFEYEIPKTEGEMIISEIKNPIIKERFYLHFKEKEWIIDRFKGKNFPLEIAEVELETIDEQIDLPNFLSTEITGLKKFSNFELSRKPFSGWDKNILN
tara:strand:- start:254 stop:736 length:483 start_codon:yes stop_codon:yes gene_type:complete